MGGISLLLIPRGDGVTTKIIKTSYSSSAGTAYVYFEVRQSHRAVAVHSQLGAFCATGVSQEGDQEKGQHQSRRFLREALASAGARVAGVPGLAWCFTGCRFRGSPHYFLQLMEKHPGRVHACRT